MVQGTHPSGGGGFHREQAVRLSRLGRLAWPIWFALLLIIPFASHPWVAAVTGSTGVSPLSGIPMALLVVTWLPIYLWKVRSAPGALLILGAYLTAAALSSSLAFFLPIFLPDGASMLAREARSLSTLAAGIGFFALAATLPRTESDLKATLRWLYIGALHLLIYSTFEIRILAETGVVGLSIFLGWVVEVGASAARLFRRTGVLANTLGLAGLLALLAMAIEGFSLDTFALPQLWITLGLVVAVSRMGSESTEVNSR